MRDVLQFLDQSEQVLSTYESNEYAPSGSTGAWADMYNAQNSIGASLSITYATNVKMEGAS